MYSPHPYTPLVNARIDDLRRSMSASRGRHSSATSHPEPGARKPRLSASTSSIRVLVARFAH
jgi:hypothetical protein